jgi:hypothetical protein
VILLAIVMIVMELGYFSQYKEWDSSWMTGVRFMAWTDIHLSTTGSKPAQEPT